MAVQKTISYRDKNGVLRTVNVTVDLEKIAFGENNDSEEVYLTVNAPGISTDYIWRRNIDKIVEDGLFASGVYTDGGNHATRYSGPTNPSGVVTDFGTSLVDGLPANISGVVTQLRFI
jgi:hypothetical protein